eukprot:TRINITY_DN70405_c0_g1_i1.p2 TRINITY_DN70405_c0_g1~~TRINITY_DN70405_c0_g1_i1.p2  ORF type:complete len:211 (+),score=90.88 TRINITY_DN70405_c0_g1_i1:77-634(+)
MTLTDNTTIVIVGMRAAGKTTMGRVIATALGRRFVDMDDFFVERTGGQKIGAFVAQHGWAAFRAREAELLRECLRANPRGAVIACGGGVVETPECRALLKGWPLVVEVARPIEDIVAFLERPDATGQRPSFPEHPREVYARRRPLFAEVCSHRFDYRGRTQEEFAAEQQRFAAAVRQIVSVGARL